MLQNFRLQPHAEAIIRLRYATVLHQETENYKEAEEALSKGVWIICTKNGIVRADWQADHYMR